jgi:hypothetical protein
MRIKDLTEMSIAAYGEWDTKLGYLFISKAVMKNKYTHIGTIQLDTGYEVYKLNNFDEYKIGFFGEKYDDLTQEITDKFAVSAEIDFLKIQDFAHYTNILSVKGVNIVQGLRGAGLGSKLYELFINAGYTLMGGEEQYYGARLLWKKFSNSPIYQVDIVDIATNTILETNVKLHHGEEDYDFDQRVWAYTPEKKDIRLILTKR